MASTNKTTNYELSQYIGTDKPTYLGDYNSDMSKIDNAIHGVSQAVGTETSRINVIEGNIGSLASLQTTDKSSVVNAVNEVNTKSETNKTNIGTIANLETENKTTIVNAINEIVEKFNINDFNEIATSTMTTSIGTFNARTKMNIAYNNDKSIFKLYGFIGIGSIPQSSWGSTNFTITIPSDLRPSQQYTINGACVMITQATTALSTEYPLSRVATPIVTISTNGNIIIEGDGATNIGRNFNLYFAPCMYFNKSFGDIPA